MANLVTEGFDWFPSGQSSAQRQLLLGANNMFQHGTVVPDVDTGRFGFGAGLSYNFSTVSGGGDPFTVVPIGAAISTGFMGVAMFVYPDMDTNNGALLGFFDGVSNGPQLTLLFAANGVIKVYRGDTSGAFLGSSIAGAYQNKEWFHIEAKPVIATSGGTIEIRVNTVPVVQITGANTQNTANAYFDSIFVGGHIPVNFTQVHCTFDDLFVNDTTGTSNNNWSGNLRVKTQFMIANGATDNMTIGGTSPAATNWQSVLNQSLDDTKYVYSATVGNLDLYTPDPNLNAPFVRAVQVRAALRQDDATQRSAKMLLRIGATVYANAAEHFTNQTFTFYKARWDLSPATSVSFTGAEVNGLQAGLKVQS